MDVAESAGSRILDKLGAGMPVIPDAGRVQELAPSAAATAPTTGKRTVPDTTTSLP